MPSHTAPSPLSSSLLPIQPSKRHLPEECVQAIFVHLAADITTLHSLILTSRAFFRIATPFLYSSPFDLLESHHAWPPQDRSRRHAVLLYLLLNCRRSGETRSSKGHGDSTPHTSRLFKRGTEPLQPPKDDLHFVDSLWASLPPVCPDFQSAHQSLQRPLVDYLSYYHHHYLCMNLYSTFSTLFPTIQQYTPPPPSENTTATTTITMYTRNQIERTFLMHSPDRILTISLPIQRLSAFQSIGPVLSHLTRFELKGVSWHFDLGPAVDFVERHSVMYGTIRELKMAGPNDNRMLRKPSLHAMVKAVRSLRVLDLSRYKEASKDLSSFEIRDRDTLEQLLFDLDFVPPLPHPDTVTETTTTGPPQTEATAFDHGPASIYRHLFQGQSQNGTAHLLQDRSLELVQNCPRLTHLQIGIRSPRALRWAAERYQAARDFSASPMSPQLKVLHLSSNHTVVLKEALEDGLYAFRDSLQDLQGVALKLSAAVPVMEPSFGWNWDLTKLTVLSLKGELAAWFNLDSLQFCPKLVDLRLTLYPYTPTRARHLEKIVLAPQLKSLALVGRWILSAAILESFGKELKDLDTLILDGCHHGEEEEGGLTAEGLIAGLERMERLKMFEYDLGQAIDVALKVYAVQRPSLEVCQAKMMVIGRQDGG